MSAGWLWHATDIFSKNSVQDTSDLVVNPYFARGIYMYRSFELCRKSIKSDRDFISLHCLYSFKTSGIESARASFLNVHCVIFALCSRCWHHSKISTILIVCYMSLSFLSWGWWYGRRFAMAIHAFRSLFTQQNNIWILGSCSLSRWVTIRFLWTIYT